MPRGRKIPSWMQRRPRQTPPRWARLFLYRVNRERYFLRSTVVPAAPPPPLVIADLPTEIMVKIFWYVVAFSDNQYVVALPLVCSRWTRIIYDFVYVHGFRVNDYDNLLKMQFNLFEDTLARTKYNAVLPEDVCRSIFCRYRLGMHPRVLTFTILSAEDKEGSEHSHYAAQMTQNFCFDSFGVLFKDLEVDRPPFNLMICLFVLEFTQHIFRSLRRRLQIVLETKFINRLDSKYFVDSEVSILDRSTIWHDFASEIKEGLAVIHELIDTKLAILYSGVELTPNMRRRIIYLLKNIIL